MLPAGSEMIIGKVYEFKNELKNLLPSIKYHTLKFNGGHVMKDAWVLPGGASASDAPTLKSVLEKMNIKVNCVTDADLDGSDDDFEKEPEVVDAEAVEDADA